ALGSCLPLGAIAGISGGRDQQQGDEPLTAPSSLGFSCLSLPVPLPCRISLIGAPVRIKLRTPMLLRFHCNFVRLEDDLQFFNVPQTCGVPHGEAGRTAGCGKSAVASEKSDSCVTMV